MPARNVSKFIPLVKLQEIQANGYRSANSRFEYDKAQIDNEINLKLAKKSDKAIKASLCPLEEWEDERQELKTLITTLKKSGSKFLSDFTLTCIANDISKEIVNYK